MPARTLQSPGSISGSESALNGEDCKGCPFLLLGGGRGREKKEELLFGKCPLFSNAPVRHCWVKHLVYQRFRGPRGEACTLFEDLNIRLWDGAGRGERSFGERSLLRGPPWWLSGKESTHQCRKRRFSPWVRKMPWKRK